MLERSSKAPPLKVRTFSEANSIVSYRGPIRPSRTIDKTQEGTLGGQKGLSRLAPCTKMWNQYMTSQGNITHLHMLSSNRCYVDPQSGYGWGCNIHSSDLNPCLDRKSTARLTTPGTCTALRDRNLFSVQRRIWHANRDMRHNCNPPWWFEEATVLRTSPGNSWAKRCLPFQTP